MQNGKTIKQIADEIGVSRQAIYKKIKKEPLSTSLQGLLSTVDNQLTVSVDGERLIKQAFSRENCQPLSTSLQGLLSTGCQRLTVSVDDSSTNLDTPDDDVYAVLKATIDTLQEQLKIKDEQLEAKDRQIESLTDGLRVVQETQQQLTAALTAAQTLHAGTIQQQLTHGAESEQPHTEIKKKKDGGNGEK